MTIHATRMGSFTGALVPDTPDTDGRAGLPSDQAAVDVCLECYYGRCITNGYIDPQRKGDPRCPLEAYVAGRNGNGTTKRGRAAIEPPDGYLTLGQIAERLGRSQRTIAKRLQMGWYRGAKKQGGVWIVPEVEGLKEGIK